MEWWTNVWVPLIIAIFTASATLIGTLAGVRVQLKINEKKAEEDRKKSDEERERKEEQRQKRQEEALKSLLRTQLLTIYFRHIVKDQKFLTQWESENMHKLYASYVALDGNSFVQDLVGKMSEWDVVQN